MPYADSLTMAGNRQGQPFPDSSSGKRTPDSDRIPRTSQAPAGTPGRLSYTRPADLLLPRLDRVRDRGPGSWVACCPAHEDRDPSLSVRETADGTLLLRCFSGCDVHSIVAAVGLELCNLFPPRDTDYGPRRKAKAPPFPWRDAIRTLKEDLSAISIGAALCANEDLPEQDCLRLALAASRIRDLIEVAE